MTEQSEQAVDVREWVSGKPVPEQTHRLVGIALPALLACVQMWRVRGHTVDDAYISFRYARNFANGLGLVYNAGERIEGYTNFAWTLVLGVLAKVGLDIELCAKLIGAGSVIASIALSYFIAARLRPMTLAPCVAGWLLASTTVFAGYGVFGLETTSFTCLVLAGTWLFLREEEANSGVPWSGLCFAAAGLSRPEAPLFLGVLMLFVAGKPLLAWRKKKRRHKLERKRAASEALAERGVVMFSSLLTMSVLLGVALALWQHNAALAFAAVAVMALAALMFVVSLPRTLFGRRNLVRGALFLIPVTLHLVWRKSYYQSWLPNTLAAKTGDLTAQIDGGAHYLWGFIEHEGPVIYLGLFGLAAGLLYKRLDVLAIAAVALCGGSYVVLIGGDWMTLFRFMAPFAPFVFLLVDLALRTLVERRDKLANYGLLLFSLVCVAQRSRQMTNDVKMIMQQEKAFWDTAAGGVSDWFAQRAAERGLEASQGTIALGDIGRVGYRTDYPILDLLGLVDPVISGLPGGYTRKIGPGFRDYFFEQKPRYFILISAEGDCDHPSVPGSQVLYHDPRFKPAYAVAGQVALDASFRWCIYEHVDHR